MRLIKRIFGFAFSRLFLVAFMILFQLGVMAAMGAYFYSSAMYYYVAMQVVSFVVAVFVVLKFAGERMSTVGGKKAAACWMVIFRFEAGSGSPCSRACTTSGL